LDGLAEILNGLKGLDLAPQSFLGTLKKTTEGIRPNSGEDAKDGSLKQQKNKPERTSEDGVIVLSSDPEADNLMPMRSHLPKATRLNMLTKRASDATDNATLAVIVKEFVDVMKMNSSRTLTKEAFGFLDILFKQLDDPSVFISPKRFGWHILRKKFILITGRPGLRDNHHSMSRFQRKNPRMSNLV
jgi:casein kinase 1